MGGLRLRSSIRLKIMVAAAVAVTGVLASYAAYNDHFLRKVMQHNVEHSLDGIGAAAAQGVGNWLAGRMLLAETAAYTIAATNTDADPPPVLANKSLEGTFLNAYFGTSRGAFTSNPEIRLPSDFDPRIQPWYLRALATRGTALTEPYADATTGRLKATVAVPVIRDGSVAGIFGGDISLDGLASMLKGFEVASAGHVFLVSGDGRILLHPDRSQVSRSLADVYPDKTPLVRAGIESALSGQRESIVTFVRVPGLNREDWHLALSMDAEQAYAGLGALRVSAAFATICAALLALLILGHVFHRLVARPLNMVTDAMDRLSQGDLATEIRTNGRDDEISTMVRAVRAFKDALMERARYEEEARARESQASLDRRRTRDELAASFESRVAVMVRELSAASAELEATARTMTATADLTRKKSEYVTSSAEQTSITVQTVAAATEELATTAREIGQQVQHSAEIAKQAFADAEKAEGIMQNLHASAQRIDEVVKAIGNVAGQTNLLALNATIEAARAGEAGKGFAIVAQEVKSLSGQTARATREIAAQVGQVQAETRQAVEAISSIRDVIARVNSISAAIAAAVEEQQGATQEIARNVSQAAQGTEDVTRNIVDVSTAAAEAGTSAEHVLSSAKELTRASDKLGHEVEGFLNGIRSA